jgi:ankyrin repeat protein
MSESGPLKNLPHSLLIDLVREFAPAIPDSGVCNGFISMWIQAVETDEPYEENHESQFYKRLDWLSSYFSHPYQSAEALKKDIDLIFLNSEKKSGFSKQELEKIDKRAFAESIAIQQDPNALKLTSTRYVSQNKKTSLYKLTISKALQFSNNKINSTYIGVIAPSIKKLQQYLDDLQTTLLNIESKKKIAFMLCSDNHSVGMYFNILTKKWRFLNINFLSKKETYYFDLNSNKLAPLIFDSFYDDKNSRTLFSIYHISLSYRERLNTVTHLKMITNILLTNSIGRTNSRGYNTLMLASCDGDIDVVEDLIEKCPALVNATNSFGVTALLIAAQEGHVSIIKKLIKTGAQVNAANFKKYTPLIWAVINNHRECVKKLIEAGANVNTQNIKGDTALIFSAKNGNALIIADLIMAKANINQVNSEGQSALIFAANSGDIESVEKLIHHGSNINLKDKQSKSALMFAALNGFSKIVKILINNGANINYTDLDNKTALMIATENHHTETAKILSTSPMLLFLKNSYHDFMNSFAATEPQFTPKEIKQSELLFNLRRLRI